MTTSHEVDSNGTPNRDGVTVLDRAVTLILPGPLSLDGTEYRAFRPYAQFANALSERFARVIVSTQVITSDSVDFHGQDEPLRPEVEVQGLPAPPEEARRSIWASLVYQVRRAAALVPLLRSWDIIYVFIPSYPGAVAYTINRLLHRRPVAVYIANDWEEITPYNFRWGGWRRRLLYPAYRSLLTGWERWIMRSTPLGLTAGRALLDKYGGEDRPVYETIPLLDMTPAHMVRREDIPADQEVSVLYVGSLHQRKGLPILFEAAARLQAEGREFRLDVVGDGPLRQELEAQARDLGISERLTFHGYVSSGPELYRFYREAGLFVLPTYSEGFPRVLYEAMGHSVPVVASAVSGIPYLLEDGVHGMLVPPGRPDRLAEAMRRVLDDAPLRRSLIRNGFELVEPIIARDPASQFVDLYRRHLAPNEGPPQDDR